MRGVNRAVRIKRWTGRSYIACEMRKEKYSVRISATFRAAHPMYPRKITTSLAWLSAIELLSRSSMNLVVLTRPSRSQILRRKGQRIGLSETFNLAGPLGDVSTLTVRLSSLVPNKCSSPFCRRVCGKRAQSSAPCHWNWQIDVIRAGTRFCHCGSAMF